jgi:hypothetical protein
MSEASPQVRALYRSCQPASSRVVGSPGLIRSLRSRGSALCHTAGHWQAVGMVGAMNNLNPSDLQPTFLPAWRARVRQVCVQVQNQQPRRTPCARGRDPGSLRQLQVDGDED